VASQATELGVVFLQGQETDMVVEGVLEKISGGNVISSAGTGAYTTKKLGGLYKTKEAGQDIHAGWSKREFIDVGGQRIRNLDLTPYYDQLLQEAIGEEIALSLDAKELTSDTRRTVIAIRTPKGGVARPSKKQLWLASIVWTFKSWVAAVVFFFMLLLLAAIVGAIFSENLAVVVFLAAVGVALYFLIKPLINMRKSFKAAAALDGVSMRPSAHPAA
jgi:hypothetical protein